MDIMRIELELKGLQSTIGGFEQIQKSMDRLDQKTKTIAGPSGGRGPSGPQGRLFAAQERFSASPSFDNQYALSLAQKSFERAQRSMRPPSAGDNIMKALMSSRFGLSGGHFQMMPLIGQTLKALGPGGPFAVAAQLVITEFKALADAAQQAAKANMEFAGARFHAGGTNLETAQLGALGGAAGVDQQGMADMARQFANELATNGAAMSAFGKFGIRDFDPNGIFGNTDKAVNLLKAAEIMYNLSEKDAQRLARIAPALEPLLRLRLLRGTDTMAELRADAAISSNIHGREAQMSSAFLEAQSNRLSTAFKNLNDTTWPATLLMAKFDESLANATEGFAAFISKVEHVIFHLPERKPGDAQSANTAALTELTYELRQQRALYGGGQRAQKAVPAMWRGDAFLNAAAAHQTARLGTNTL